MSRLARRLEALRTPANLTTGEHLQALKDYHPGPGGFVGTAMDFIPDHTFRAAALNVQNSAHLRDAVALGEVIGRYCARWKVTFGCVSEVPLFRNVAATLGRGLAP